MFPFPDYNKHKYLEKLTFANTFFAVYKCW